MRILAMDTATSAITVAVHDGQGVLATRAAVDARRHTELLAPMLVETMAAAGTGVEEITHVAVGTGPGPFTGLRVGLVTAQTFAHARGISVHGVCSLDALAAAAAGQGHEGDLLVATDARRKEVYLASYDRSGQRLEGPVVTKPGDVATGVPVAGAGPALYPESFPQPWGPDRPSAGWLARVVSEERADLLDPEPLYLRRPDAVASRPPGPTL